MHWCTCWGAVVSNDLDFWESSSWCLIYCLTATDKLEFFFFLHNDFSLSLCRCYNFVPRTMLWGCDAITSHTNLLNVFYINFCQTHMAFHFASVISFSIFLSLWPLCSFDKKVEVGLSSGQVLEMINNPHYLYRMTILRAISLLAPVMGSEITCSKLLPVVISSSKDRYLDLRDLAIHHEWSIIVGCWLLVCFAFGRVPNIKFNVAKVLQSLIPIVDQSVCIFTVALLCFPIYYYFFQIFIILRIHFLVSLHFMWCFSSPGLNYCNRWWRRQSVPVWLSLVRIRMLMSVFSLLKPFSRLITLWCLARRDHSWLIWIHCRTYTYIEDL